MPVFFLYFSSKLSLQEVLLLESVYYISVVLLEVPTGYFSDLVGRRITLLLGAFSLIIACILYLLGNSFLVLAIGQIVFAFHMSFISGTNTVFHYESLLAAGKEAEYGDREAIVNQYGSIAGGTAALLGGLFASYHLSSAYIISMMAGIIAVVVAFGFVEPEGEDSSLDTPGVIAQLRTTLGFMRLKPLGWLAAYFIIFYCITHLPYEFYQPYIQLLSERDLLFGLSVTFVSGFIYATARYISAFGASYSMIWSRRLGMFNFLLIAILIITSVVVLMSSLLNVLALGFILLRSTPWMAIKAPINEIITPMIGSGQRATYHSILSLLCRLSFFLVLLGLSFVVDKESLIDWTNLSKILQISAVGSIILLIPLMIYGRSIFRHSQR